MVLSGAGQGLIMAPLTSLGIEDAPQEVAGSASGLTNTMHQLGVPIGLSILVAQGANFQFNLGMMGIFIVIAILILMFLTKEGRLVNLICFFIAQKNQIPKNLVQVNGWPGDRTLDPRIKSPLLCQLS